MSEALLIIDIQNFYFEGKSCLDGHEKASLNAARLLDHFRKNNSPIFHIVHEQDKANLTEAEIRLRGIHASVQPREGEPIISKQTPGSFKNTLLQKLLKDKGISELVICGMMSQMCVDTTTREAFDLDYKCTVIHDACATRSFTFNGLEVPAEFVHATAMSALGFAFAKVTGCEEYLMG